MSDQQIFAAIDLGSTKVCALVGQALEEDRFEIVGIGTASTHHGIRNGTIVDVQQTVAAIRKAVEIAGRKASHPLTHVVVGFAGGEIEGQDQRVMIALKDREVQESDIDRILQEARTMMGCAPSELLHTIPKGYRIDEQGGILNPIGMVGARLEAQVHVIRGSDMVLANLKRSVERAGLTVREGDLVLQPLASARAVLTEDDKELGVCVVDIGGGTTGMVLYQNGALSGVRVVPLGGAAMTKDLAAVLRISQADAERVKREVFATPGHSEPPAPEEEDAPAPSEEAMSAAGRRVQVREVVEARLEEILRKVKSDLDRLRQGAFLARGVVLTGGVAKMPNIVSFAEKIFEMPVSVGHPGERVQGLVDQTSGPEFASAVGLLYFARDQWSPAEVPVRELPIGETASPVPVKKEREGPPAGVRLWNWLREII
ncbi:MAG: cell division protein FtsA [Nitrospirae bacterium]|uniref:Cell division protein FtsA n=1 Tax=Leptospirillum ferrodiazotrophum TaxID=412449 RepID=C6HX64_9BACT|nr:MAG: cell division protein FtsA [Leptospirillum ferrodiazotrophum]MCL5953479.1 cell division protein FtsA [Nitrospirota bacterium]